MAREPLSLPGIFQALCRHLRLLREYLHRAFAEGNSDYLGEIAGKLRVLVHEKGQKALLLGLMDFFKVDIKRKIDKPGRIVERNLRDQLEAVGCMVTTPSGSQAYMTGKQFLATWAEQDGAAHQDWTHTDSFFAARQEDMLINGLPPSALLLKGMAEAVLIVGEQFVRGVTEAQMSEKAKEWAARFPPSPTVTG